MYRQEFKEELRKKFLNWDFSQSTILFPYTLPRMKKLYTIGILAFFALFTTTATFAMTDTGKSFFSSLIFIQKVDPEDLPQEAIDALKEGKAVYSIWGAQFDHIPTREELIEAMKAEGNGEAVFMQEYSDGENFLDVDASNTVIMEEIKDGKLPQELIEVLANGDFETNIDLSDLNIEGVELKEIQEGVALPIEALEAIKSWEYITNVDIK